MGLLLLVGGGLALHGWQLGRTRAELFAKSDAAKEAGDLVAARQWLERCVLIDPSDHEAMLHLLSLTGPNSSLIEQRHALALAESVLKRWPDRVDLRARVAELNVVDSPGVALSEAEEVLKIDPREPTALRVRALARDVAQIGPSTPLDLVAAVIDDYRRANESSPDDLLTAFRRATLARLHAEGLARREGLSPEQFEFKADAIVDGIVAKSDGPRARLGRYLYRLRFLDPASGPGESEEIEADLRAAVGLAPNDADLRLVLAEKLARYDLAPAHHQKSDITRTLLSHLTLAHGGRGSDPRVYLGIADIFWLQGEADQAIATLETGIGAVADWAIDLLARLATFHVARGEWDAAGTALARADELLARTRHRFTPTEQDELVATVVLARVAWLVDPKSPARDPYAAAEYLQAIEKGDCRPDTLFAIAFTLGRVLLEINTPGEALAAFLRASAVAPASVAPRLGIAQALEHDGQYQAAADAYEELAAGQIGNPTPEERAEAWFGLGCARIALARGQDAGDTRWLAVDRAIAEFETMFPDSYLPAFLEVERAVGMAASADRLDARAAAEPLRVGAARFGGQVGFWRLALDVYLRLGLWDLAEEAIERADVLAGSVDQEARDRLEVERGMETEGAADVDFAPIQQARRAWRVVQDAQNALAYSDAAGIEEIGNGTLGSDALARALGEYLGVLARIARQSADSSIDPVETQSACRALLARRPWWNLSHHAAGLWAEARGDRLAAIQAYQAAVRLGDDTLISARRLLAVLVQTQKWAEASRLLERSPAAFSLRPDVLPIALLVHARIGEESVGLALAKRAVATRPDDSETQVVLGIAALAAREESSRAVADRAFRSAVELDPTNLRAWLGLLYLHVASEPPRDLSATLAALRGSMALLGSMTDDISQPVRSILVGCGFEFGGQVIEADPYFFRSSEPAEPAVGPSLPRPLAPVALMRQRPLANLPHAVNPARLPVAVQRMVGLIVLAGDATEKDSAAWLGTDQGLAALVSLCRGGPSELERAVDLLNADLVSAGPTARGAELLLARTLQLQGLSDRALDHYRNIARQASEESGPAAARVLAECGAFFIAVGRLDDAAMSLAALERHPPSLEQIHLRLTLDAAQGNEEECLAAAEECLLATHAAERLHRARQLHAWLGHTALGASLRERLRSQLESVEAGDYLFADFAIASGQAAAVPAAFALCQSLDVDSSAWPAAWLAARLLARDTGPETDRAAIEAKLEAVAATLAANPSLASQWIQLLALRRRVSQALALSDELARHFPQNAAIAAQRLLLMVDDPDVAPTALASANDAIRRHGPLPSLLDAKAMILVARGRPAEALALLEANASVPASPAFSASPLALLHLAEAYRQAGHLAHARATRARLNVLTPFDPADLSLSDRSALRLVLEL